MILGDKDFALDFKYYQLKQVARGMGVDLHQVPETIVENGSIAFMCEFGVKCIFYGSGVFESEDEVAKLVTSTEPLTEAGKAYMESFNQFMGLKGDNTGEPEAH